MKGLLSNKWFTIVISVLIVALSIGCFYTTSKNKKFQQKQETLLSGGLQGFLERTRNEKVKFGDEESQRENEKKAEQEREWKEQQVNQTRKWIQGTWSYRGRLHVYGYQYMNVEYTLLIDGNYITAIANGSIVDQGEISDIDIDESIIHFGSHSYIEFNSNCEKIYTGTRSEGTSYHKVSNSVSLSGGATGGSSYSGSTSSGSRLMTKFNKLNEEGRKLVGEIERYYRTGQAGPWVITDVYRLKSIQDEKISLAQEMGDRDLERLCRQQKAQTLAALRQMGF